MKIYLAQHGEAHSKDQDPERSLTDAGVADIERLGVFLSRASIGVERVIHSGKLRAEQTARILAAAIAPEVSLETGEQMSPNDDAAEFDWHGDRAQDTLIVGHLPFVARLVSQLLIGSTEPVLTAFRPGTILCLEQNPDGEWAIGWMLRPELLE